MSRLMATSWNAGAPQDVSAKYRDTLRQKYTDELNILLLALPTRFKPIIQHCLDRLDAVFSLPMVLLHRNLGTSDILVDPDSCHLTGVVDWAGAEISPFGLNLHHLEAFTGALHLKNGWRRYGDYEELQGLFWRTFGEEVGGLTAEMKKAIETARVLRVLLSSGVCGRFSEGGPAYADW